MPFCPGTFCFGVAHSLWATIYFQKVRGVPRKLVDKQQVFVVEDNYFRS